jgi:hypothetical protein
MTALAQFNPYWIEVRKTTFCSQFCTKIIILPRQARDRHRETTETEGHFSQEPTSPDDILGHATIQRALDQFQVRCVRGCLQPRTCIRCAVLLLCCLTCPLKDHGTALTRNDNGMMRRHVSCVIHDQINVATGEQISNKVMHKQYLQVRNATFCAIYI